MTNLLTPRRISALLLLAGCWAGAQAQWLGTPAADVLLGRPLDMSLPVRFANDGSGDNDCVRADVFYGESRVKDGSVRATVTGPAEPRRIRIEADTPIDEPIVTVSVRAGCRNTVTRNYTLLPEYPSERLLAAADARKAMAVAAPAAPLQLARAAPPAAAPRKPAPRPVVLARAAASEPAPAPVRARSSSHRAPRAETVARGPRLQLEPIELPERDALLRVSTSLAEPNGDASRRATAALLWQAINADPEEVLRTSVMAHKLEQDLSQLRQASGQTRAEMAALRQRMDQAHPWYLAPLFVQLLSLLLVAATGVAAYLWWRMRGPRAAPGTWYLPQEPQQAGAAGEADAPVVPVAPAVAKPVRGEPPAAPSTRVPRVVAAKVPVDAGALDFDLPAQAAPRAPADEVLRVETLAATVEEVDFLSSLGLLPDAMDRLKTYLQDSAGPAPIAYLELMRLCEQAGDAAAVATVRRRYVQAFGVEAPRLPQVTADTGLDGLPALAARVTQAWKDGEAPQVIAQILFSVPTPAAPITLQAGRDLLALHGLALARAAEGTAGAHEAPLAPWAEHHDTPDAHEAARHAAEAEGGRQFGLDVDLSATGAPVANVSAPPPPTLELVPAAADPQEEARREEAERRAREADEAFSAAMASERVPVSRF